MAEKCNLYELQKKIPYEIVMPILAAWDEQSDRDITDLARMAYYAGRNSILKKPDKMQQVAEIFCKKLGERFKVKRDNEVFDCAITRKGIYCFSAYENPYIDLNAFVLYDLLTGEAVIVGD